MFRDRELETALSLRITTLEYENIELGRKIDNLHCQLDFEKQRGQKNAVLLGALMDHLKLCFEHVDAHWKVVENYPIAIDRTFGGSESGN